MKQPVHPRTVLAIGAFMAAMPGTKSEIIQRSGLNHTTVTRFIRRFHRLFIRVCAWRPHPVRGPESPIFDLGCAPDAIDKRRRLTRSQISARYEDRIHGTDAFDRRRAKRASIYFEKKAKKTPQSWFSALGV